MRSSLVLAVRRLRRTPVFTVTTVVSLALGIGLASSVASVAESALRPNLPYSDPEELFEVLRTARPGSSAPSDFGIPADLATEWLRADLRSVEQLAGEGLAIAGEIASTDGSRQVGLRPVLGDWFGTLGVRARIGRVLGSMDLGPGATPALVASDGFWRKYLAGSPDAIGRSVRISDINYVVVGVLPSSYSSDEAAWVNGEAGARPAAFRMVARLRDGMSAEDVAVELTRATSLSSGSEGGVVAISMTELSSSADRSRMWLLIGAVGAILLVGVLNLTNLFLVRAQAGRANMAIRRSLGATPSHLVRGTVEDSLVIGLLGGGIGLVLGLWGKEMVYEFAGASSLSPSAPAMGVVSVAIALVVPLLIAATVALQEVRTLSRDPLKAVLQTQSGGPSGTARDRRVRNALVALQVAGSVVLIVAGTMLGFAFQQYRSLDLGYDLDRAVLLVPEYEDRGVDRTGQTELASRLSQRLSLREEVSEAALIRITYQPYPPVPEGRLRIDRGSAGIETLQSRGAFYEVDPTFFNVVGVELTSGRGLTEQDGSGAPAVAIVNDAAKRMWWGGEDPVGRQVQLGEGGEWLTVVGTVNATHRPSSIGRLVRAQGATEEPLLFRPLAQSTVLPPRWEDGPGCSDITGGCGRIHLLIQASGEPSAAMRAAREEVAVASPPLDIAELETVAEAQLGFIGQEIHLLNRLLTAAAVIGVLLGALGIVGVVSDSVVRRTREIGVRMALGARAPQVVAAIGREAALTALAGVGIGLVSLLALSANLGRVQFFELIIGRWQLASGLLDPVFLLIGLGGLLFVVLSAAGLTALRALKVDPAVALRSEF